MIMANAPPGFVLDQQQAQQPAEQSGLPPGFVLDESNKKPTKPVFGSDEHVKKLSDKYGASPDYIRGILNSQTSAEGVKGMPGLGGFANRIGAAAAAVAHPLTGAGASGTLSERYSKDKALNEEIERDFEEAHPNLALASQAIGGVTSTGAAGMTALGGRALGLVGTLGQQVVRGGLSGAALGGIDAAARGQDPTTAAAIGGGLGVVGPLAGRAVNLLTTPAREVIGGIRNAEGAAQQRMASALQSGHPMTPQEIQEAEAAGHPIMPIDYSEGAQAMARSAANTSPEARATMNAALDARFETQIDRLNGFFNREYHFPDMPAQQRAIDQVEQAANNRMFGLARRTAGETYPGGIWSPELARLSSDPDVVEAMQIAARRTEARRVMEGELAHPKVRFNDGVISFERGPGGNEIYPDLRFWHNTLRYLSDDATAAFRGGRSQLGSEISGARRQLADELDRMVPEFGEARAGAARFFGAENALEAGSLYATQGRRPFSADGARRALARMSDNERRLFQDGFVSTTMERLRSYPETSDLSRRIMNSPKSIEQMQVALGIPGANRLQAFIHIENLMSNARRAVQGNSTTARQLFELGLAGGAGELANALGGGGNPFADPMSYLSSAMMFGALRGRAVINQRVATQVARLMVSDNPAQVRAGINMIANQPRLMSAVRNADAAIGAIVTRGLQPAITNAAQ
jgi:hypothetical protein